MDELLIRTRIQNELLHFKICNNLCFNEYSNKQLTQLEKNCLKGCYIKLNEVEHILKDVYLSSSKESY